MSMVMIHSRPGPGAWVQARLATCVIDRGRREILRGQGVAPVEPRAFDVLCHLLDHRHHAVSKDALLGACWGDDPPGDGALARAVMKARQAIDDLDESRPLIRTVHRVGYKLSARAA